MRDRRNTLEACQCERVVFSWQAQHFVLVHFKISWQAQHFVTWRRCCFDESQCQGGANLTQCHKLWQGRHFVCALGSWGGASHKSYFLSRVKNGSQELVYLQLQSVKSESSLA